MLYQGGDEALQGRTLIKSHGVSVLWECPDDPQAPAKPPLSPDARKVFSLAYQLVNFGIDEMLNLTTYLGGTGSWIQQVTPPTLAVTCWIPQPACILHSSCKGWSSPTPVQEHGKMHVLGFKGIFGFAKR